MSATQTVKAAPPISPAFATVTTLFFTWGFITSVIDPLIPTVRAVFHLSYAESMLTQFAWFMAYGVVSLPAAAVVARLNYAGAILAALSLMLAGCLLIPLATKLDAYPLVLSALFVIASGVTVLQVAANPLSAALGPPERSHFRLVLSQAFNSLGTVIGPFFGAMVMLRGGVFGGGSGAGGEGRAQTLAHVDLSFLIVAALIACVIGFIALTRKQLSTTSAQQASAGEGGALIRAPWALMGAGAIFLYVGAEVTIGSLMTNFLHQPSILNLPIEQAGKMVSLYWLGAMVGRFLGGAALTRVSAGRLLAVVAGGAALLSLTVAAASGAVAAVAALAIGLFNAVMFPTIFTLTLERSSAGEAKTSGLLCMAIVGGAILPFLAGVIADLAALRVAYLLPFAAYLAIAGFASLAARTAPRRLASAAAGGH